MTFNACGEALDVLRSCYRFNARLDPTRPDLLVEMEYYFCPPGAKIFDHPHILGSANYQDPKENFDIWLGEVEVTKRWVRGDTPAAVTGQFYCGDLGKFAGGVDLVNGGTEPLDPFDGMPLCCRGGVPLGGFLIQDDGNYLLQDDGSKIVIP